MLFEVGETVVYPHHGAATIIEVKERVIKGETKKYLKLNVTQGDLIIEVPAENVDLVGVRDVIGKDGLERVFDVLRAPFTEEPTNWSRRYKANPIRSPSALTSLGIGAVKQRPLTEPKPFALQSEAKHEHFAAQWSARVEQEREDERSKFSSFHARPVPKTVTHSDRVFTPRRSGKPLTEVHDVHLNVDRRIQKHQEISQRKAEREKRLEAERMAEEERRKEEEAREVRNMRRSMVIKAKAVPSSVRHGATSVVHSSKPLTEPISPNFRCLFVSPMPICLTHHAVHPSLLL